VNKNEFLDGLKNSLKGMPSKDIEEIIMDYNSHFDADIRSGKTEAEVLEAFGDYKSISRLYKENYIDKELKRESFFSHIFRAGVSVFSVFLFNLIFVLAPVVAVMAAIFALFCAAVGIAVIGVLWLLSSIGQTFLSQWIYFPSITENITFGFIFSIVAIAAGLLLFIGNYYLSKATYNRIKKYIKWNLRLNYKGEY